MQLTGTLRSWNEDKGFGFIAPTQGGRELFVHISAFPRDGTRPTVGEALLYELGQGKDGRPQAVRVVRKALGLPQPGLRAHARAEKRTTGRAGRFMVLLLVVSLGALAFNRFQGFAHRIQLEASPPQAEVSPVKGESPRGPDDPSPVKGESPSGLQCDGRTRCTQMTSCSEATWFINHCPGTGMDGNHDGVPCEQQWCTSTLAK